MRKTILLEQLNKAWAVAPDSSDWFFDFIINEYRGGLQRKHNPASVATGDFDLDKIKQIPIGELLDDTPKTVSCGREKFICPLPEHDEKTASFVWYKNNNTYYCFGCGVGGDVIDLIMRLENVSFQDACGKLMLQ